MNDRQKQQQKRGYTNVLFQIDSELYNKYTQTISRQKTIVSDIVELIEKAVNERTEKDRVRIVAM